MLQNYYTLLKLKKELNSLIGMKLIEFFSQEKDSATFNFFDGNKETFLYFTTVPFFSALYINHRFSRAKSNTFDLCPELQGDYLQEILVYECERIVEFKFIKHTVIFHIFGGANSNLFVCKNSKKVVFALNNSDKYLAQNLLQTNENVLDFFEFKDKILLDALAKSDLLLGKNYATEFCLQNNLIDKTNNLLNEFSENELQKIKENAIIFAKNLVEHSKVYKLKKTTETQENQTFFS
jgi:hypothetical protein